MGTLARQSSQFTPPTQSAYGTCLNELRGLVSPAQYDALKNMLSETTGIDFWKPGLDGKVTITDSRFRFDRVFGNGPEPVGARLAFAAAIAELHGVSHDCRAMRPNQPHAFFGVNPEQGQDRLQIVLRTIGEKYAAAGKAANGQALTFES